MKPDMNRRHFIKNAGIWLASLTFFGFFIRKSATAAPKSKAPAALPAGQVEVPATDPVASAIGYVGDVKKIDFKKYPLRKKADAKNQLCKTCSLYTPSNDGWGKCTMLTNGLVAAEGWCASWNKKS